jgi:glyoxylase-like metal-dependent hydrolase (beta-lactamase superfamily II)
MKLDRVTHDVLRLSLLPFDTINAYVLGDVLVDSGGRLGAARLFSALAGIPIAGHAVSHAHFDHQGCSHAVCERFGIPLMCGAGDRTALETGDLTLVLPREGTWIARLTRQFGGPAHPVSRTLHEGDEIGGFTVIEAPGHTPGHLAFWREHDRVLFLGDVLFHRNPVTLRHALTEPFRLATFDPAQNRRTARRLATLEPSLVCFGHGEPLRDPARFAAYVSTLEDDEPATA